MTGLIDTPTAEMQPDGELSVTAGYFGGYLRNTFSAQILPGIETAFRYSVLDDFFSGPGDTTLYDRSFDLKLRLVEEGGNSPSLVLGFQDFLGTGIYSGEYFAATKNFLGGDLKVTGGLGWGRFAGANTVDNPACTGGNRFCIRDADTDTGGTVKFGDFFSGEDIGFFGGVEWRTPVQNLVLKAESSSDDYERERQTGAFSRKIPLNFGIEYRPFSGIEIGTYYLYGSEIGVRVSITGNPFRPIADIDGEVPARAVAERPLPNLQLGSAELGEVVSLVTDAPVSIRFAEAGLANVTVEDRPDGLRWATATLPPSADYVCPDEEAKAIDAEYGMVDAVSFRHADRTPVCTIALRPAAKQAIRNSLRANIDYPTGWYDDETERKKIVERLAAALDADRIGLFGIDIRPTEVSIYIENQRFRSTPRAIGRASRALANAMPPSVELFEIIPVEGGLPVVSVMVRRSAIEDQIGRPDAARASWLTAEIAEASPPNWGDVGETLDNFPRPYWSINPYLPMSFFDPDSPLRLDLSVLATAGVEFRPGISINAAAGKRVLGNLDDIEFDSDSDLARVRSDIRSYLREGDPGIHRLSFDYVAKAADDIYGRFSFGLLEWMYGGASGELLWQPVDQSWGLGAEINWVRQRDFDQMFDFRDYDVVTGHASLYWDTGWHGISAQIDAGRYLAGDWGATFSLKRRFPTGWELGAFATFTDVPFNEFGEGSFDKGIILTIPFDWALPFENRSRYSAIIRPLTRDGGQRLSISNRLYPVVEDMGRDELRASWQEFWK